MPFEIDQNARLQAENQRIQADNTALMTALQQAAADSALVIEALSRAIQMIEVLIAYMPDGQPVHPGVVTCKSALDDAMRAMHQRVLARRTEREKNA